MTKKVDLRTILNVVYHPAETPRDAEIMRLTYTEFRNAIYRAELYGSEPSVRTAWTRVSVSPYCVGTSADRRTLLLNARLMRAEFFEAAIAGEKKEKKIYGEGTA